MNIDSINPQLEELVTQKGDTIYIKAKQNYYGDSFGVQLDGFFTIDDIYKIYSIIKGIDNASS